jgi:hypothetical protein
MELRALPQTLIYRTRAVRIFAESFFAEAQQVNLACARPFPLLVSLNLALVGGSPAPLPDAEVPDFVRLRELRENTKLGDHSEDDDVGTWQGSSEPSFLAQVPDHVLDNIPLTALLDVGADSDTSSASLSPPSFLYSPVSPSEEVDTGNQGHVSPHLNPQWVPRTIFVEKNKKEVDTGNLDIYSEQFSSASQNSRSGGAAGSYVGVDIAASGNAWGQSSAGTSVAPNRETNNVRNIVNCSSSSNENSNFITYNIRRSAHSHDARSGAANLAPGSSSSRAPAGAFVRAYQADAHNPFLSGSLNLSTSGASAGMFWEETGTSPPQFS